MRSESQNEIMGEGEEIRITVNEQVVVIRPDDNNPEDIKRCAKEQGVAVEIDFELAAEGDDGKFVLFSESETVDIKKFSAFTATAADDNA